MRGNSFVYSYSYSYCGCCCYCVVVVVLNEEQVITKTYCVKHKKVKCVTGVPARRFHVKADDKYRKCIKETMCQVLACTLPS